MEAKDGCLERNLHSLALHGVGDPLNAISSHGGIRHEVPISLKGEMGWPDVQYSVNYTSVGKFGPHNISNPWSEPSVEGDQRSVGNPRKHALTTATNGECGP